MAFVNAVTGVVGVFQDYELVASLETASDATHPILTMPMPGSSGLYKIDILLTGYATSGYGLSGTLDVSVGAGDQLVATGASGAFNTQLAPRVPVVVRLDNRSALVIAVADDDNATMATAWTGAAVVAGAGRVHVRTFQTYTAILQVDDIGPALTVIGAPVVVNALYDAGALYVDYGTGTPAITVGTDTGAGVTFSSTPNTATTRWDLSLKVRALIPAYI